MTKERREEIILIALVISLAIHVALMFLVRQEVMADGVTKYVKSHRRETMRVVRDAERPDPVRISEIMDVKAAVDAPAVKSELAPRMSAVEAVRTEAPLPEAPEMRLRPPEDVSIFDARPHGTWKLPDIAVAITKIETPDAGGMPAPEFSVAIPDFTKMSSMSLPTIGAAPETTFSPATMSGDGGRSKAPKFVAADKVYARVEEKVVEEEKKAVRELMASDEAAELEKFVNVTMTSATAGKWKYFKVMVSPRTSLQMVPKDVVIIIDGSGSVGKDRFASCRKAAKKILRTCTNTADRFNLVVFRNAFSYCFRNWRECDSVSFDAAERWLGREAAHGRTDVFSTISSVLTLPRDPARPMIALVVTDGEANEGVSDTAEILSEFTALNDGLVSVYMYGVKDSANRELIDVLTHGNRGESLIFEGWRWNAGEGIEQLSERFRDPVLSDLRAVMTSGTEAETYPRLLRNLYRGDTLSFVGRVPEGTREIAFSLRGLNGEKVFDGFFKMPFSVAPEDPSIVSDWEKERKINLKLTR